MGCTIKDLSQFSDRSIDLIIYHPTFLLNSKSENDLSLVHLFQSSASNHFSFQQIQEGLHESFKSEISEIEKIIRMNGSFYIQLDSKWVHHFRVWIEKYYTITFRNEIIIPSFRSSLSSQENQKKKRREKFEKVRTLNEEKCLWIGNHQYFLFYTKNSDHSHYFHKRDIRVMQARTEKSQKRAQSMKGSRSYDSNGKLLYHPRLKMRSDVWVDLFAPPMRNPSKKTCENLDCDNINFEWDESMSRNRMLEIILRTSLPPNGKALVSIPFGRGMGWRLFNGSELKKWEDWSQTSIDGVA